MAYVFRLVFFSVSLLLCNLAHAVITFPATVNYTTQNSNQHSGQVACTAAIETVSTGTYTKNARYVSHTDSLKALNCTYLYDSNNTTPAFFNKQSSNINTNRYLLCPTGSTGPVISGINGTCSRSDCPVGQFFNQTTLTCSSTPECPKGNVLSSGFYGGGSNPNASFSNVVCQSGCSATFSGVWPSKQSCSKAGVCTYYAEGSFTTDGNTCTGGGSLPAALNAAPMGEDAAAALAAQNAADAAYAAALAAKQAQDAANTAAAHQMAADAATAAAAAKIASDAAAAKASAAAADAKAAAAKAAEDEAAHVSVMGDPNATQAAKDAAAATASASAGAAAGAAGASSAAAGAAAGAASAAAAAAGAAASASLPDKPKDPVGLCTQYPNIAACTVSGFQGGFCVDGQLRGASCNGDAIQCGKAMADASFQCKMLQDDPLMSGNYNDAKSDSLANPTGKPATNLSLPTSLNASSMYGGQCNNDVTIGFNGASVVIPFSSWCPVLQSLGYLFLAMAYMAAAVILGGAI